MKKLFSILLLTLLFVGISAQKPQFTDFYNTVEVRTQGGSYVKKEQTMVNYNYDNKPYILINSQTMSLPLKIVSETKYETVNGVKWQIVETVDVDNNHVIFAYGGKKLGCIIFFNDESISLRNE